MPSQDALDIFLPPVAAWFRETLGTPTPAQVRGWPVIASGQNTLILAPTGSGKTLAAFLACLDQLWRQQLPPWGVQLLYVSPLKALNNDIHRNLQQPLEGVTAYARSMNFSLPEIRAEVRTGDTPARQRISFLRNPPQVLITTPESLHLLLTSQARDALRSVRWCIVDEIHALCPNKRGVFLALLLERLEELTPKSFVRIGLSATQRPLEEVARYLGGQRLSNDGQSWQARPVTIVDAGLRKDLDLQVLSPVEQFGPLPERSVWPSIDRLLLDLIRQHRSTIIFANNRRTVERITTRINELAAEGREDGEAEPVARAHHGSIALEVRQQTEAALKEGRLPAVVATASLELGIDMGAVDLVCQVESPGNIARALQRVGRAGHLVGRSSKGRLIPKTLPDLLEQAVLAREMAAGRVEAVRTPTNCLDVLAQQVVAMVAVDDWKPADLYTVIRRAYPYRDLSPELFESVLEMVSGRYPSEAFRDLRARIVWDRVHDLLHPLPGTKHLALVNGGTIPDTGQFAAMLAGQETRIGELDEEFVYERRIGDVFVLGTSAWRIEDIGDDRVHVTPAEGLPAMTPFWRGEGTGRSRDLGLAVGRFLRELAERLGDGEVQAWLERQCHLSPEAARNLLFFVRRQIEQSGCLPSDCVILIEGFRDPLGDWYVAVLTPFGSRFHLALRLAVEARLRQRFGYPPQSLHANDGVLLRVADMDEPPLDLLHGITPENVENLVVGELDDSPLFAIRFRQNAARALLMPRTRPNKRAPLWLQRLKGRTLLQLARQHPSFPIFLETYRECLHDHLDLDHLQQVLADIAAGRITVVRRRAEAPSPFASSLVFGFNAAFQYETDRVDPSGQDTSRLDTAVLDQLLRPEQCDHLLDARAIEAVERRLRGLPRLPRSAEEMAEWLRRVGDIAPAEVEPSLAGFLETLQAQRRVRHIHLRGTRQPERWILEEDANLYASAFGIESGHADGPRCDESARMILRRFLQTHALVSLDDLCGRYPVDRSWATAVLEQWVREGAAATVRSSDESTDRFAVPSNLQQIQRSSLALHRSEILSVPPRRFAEFVLRWQHLEEAQRLEGPSGLAEVLAQLEGLNLPVELWEQAVLPARLREYQRRWLDDLLQNGDWLWAAASTEDDGLGRLAFLRREHLVHVGVRHPDAVLHLDEPTQAVYDRLRQHGASFVVELAQATGLSPQRVRKALWNLVRTSLATNDRFDVVRRGEEAFSHHLGSSSSAQEQSPPVSPRPTTGGAGVSDRRSAMRMRRRLAVQHPEGRWSLIRYGMPETEQRALHDAHRLLDRYGIVTRELAELDESLIPWRVLYEVLSRMEWAGQVRRGYFIEGWSGAQFALPEAVQKLAALSAAAGSSWVLLHSMDPANVFGLVEALPSPVARRPGNWLVVRGGRVVLGVEAHGRRLLSASDASADELTEAARCLRGLLRRGDTLQPRGKVSVELWDGQPVTTSPGRAILEAAGFVRDYQAMTLYAGW
ncbi:MAG: DEAD/DEAH box helicase [Gemmatales bacterium]|nr:DEAD/DEAH box helicase [Gemmatales bacterium]MDW8386500.1 DEAD/DEAH box helicase [Gemmatales bacterium]